MPPPRNKGFQKPKNIRSTLKRLASYIFDRPLLLVAVIPCVLISASSGVIGTYFLRPLLNDYIVPLIGQGPSALELRGFALTLGGLAGVYALGAVATLAYTQVMLRVSNGALRKIRLDLFNKMQDLPIKYFDTHTHGEIMSRYTADVDTLREAISQGMTQLITSVVTVTGTFIMMLVLSPTLTLTVLAMLAVMLFLVKTIGSKSAGFFRRQQAAVGAVNGYIEEMIEGQKVVKVFCREQQVKNQFAQINEELRQSATNANTFASIMMPVMNNLSYVQYAITATLGAAMVINRRLDIGTIAAFLQYSRSFSQPITQISQQTNSILSALAGAERIFSLMDEVAEVDEGYVQLVQATENPDGSIVETDHHTGMWAWKHPHGDGTLTYTRLNGDVVFEHVTFGYNENEPVLNNISLYAKPGQKIAFVGSTGAGKTTITNLLNRFYEIQEGKIRYDGINIQKIKKDDLRRSLSMVLQDTHLFTGTVEENIRYGKLDATHDEVVAAAKLANAHYFIKHLPHGYGTVLTADGANLSQGQRQLLAIARAAVANPPVLILDEATSSIDTRTEALIEKGMDSLMEGRTVFVIAHRLSTVRNSKAIMVLEHGTIIERGDHDDLIAQKGKYYQLYTGMFELS